MIKTITGWLTGNAFQGQGIVFKSLRFLNLMEDAAVKFSLTGAQMWATTILNIHTQIVSHDHVMAGMAMGSNGLAMAAHAVKRGQLLNAKGTDGIGHNGGPPLDDDAPPPWTGESD